MMPYSILDMYFVEWRWTPLAGQDPNREQIDVLRRLLQTDQMWQSSAGSSPHGRPVVMADGRGYAFNMIRLAQAARPVRRLASRSDGWQNPLDIEYLLTCTAGMSALIADC
jgi:hypothetical protein